MSGVTPLISFYKHFIVHMYNVERATHVLEGPPGGGEIVEGVPRDPHHGGGRHDEPHVVGPLWVLHGTCSVIFSCEKQLLKHIVHTVFDWFPFEAVEEEDGGHDRRGHSSPAQHPVPAGQHSCITVQYSTVQYSTLQYNTI